MALTGYARFDKNLSEFVFPAVALQNKSSILALIESDRIKPATPFEKEV